MAEDIRSGRGRWVLQVPVFIQLGFNYNFPSCQTSRICTWGTDISWIIEYGMAYKIRICNKFGANAPVASPLAIEV